MESKIVAGDEGNAEGNVVAIYEGDVVEYLIAAYASCEIKFC